MNARNITPQQAYEWLKNGEAILIDVREPDEFKERHIAFAHSLPLSSITDTIMQMHFPSDKKVIMQCLAGKRGEKACVFLSEKQIPNDVFNIEGGLGAWEHGGLPVIGARGPKISIFRQVQMIMGSLIAFLVILGFVGLTFAFALAGLFAGALALAGFTGWCGLALLLQNMPWNKAR